MKRKLFSIFLCVVMILQLFGSITASANLVADGDLSFEEGATLYVDTAATRKLRMEKQAAMFQMNQARSDPDNVYYTLSVPVFEQINNYYCGPATVKQVVHFIEGASETQDDYADLLGTTTEGTNMTEIPDVLNSCITTNWTYIYDEIENQSNWRETIIYNTSMGMPVILDIATSSVSAFPYNSSGHFVNTSGVDFRVLSSGTTSKVRITDPYGPGLGNVWYNDDDLYAANNNHWRHAFIH